MAKTIVIILSVILVGVIILAFVFATATPFDETETSFGSVRITLVAVQADGTEFPVSGRQIGLETVVVENQPVVKMLYKLEARFISNGSASVQILDGSMVVVSITAISPACTVQFDLNRQKGPVGLSVSTDTWRSLFSFSINLIQMEAQLVQECQSAAGTVNLLVLISNTIKWSTIDGVVREERIGYEFSLEWIPPEPCVECPEPPVCPIEEPVCVFITASTDGRFVE